MVEITGIDPEGAKRFAEKNRPSTPILSIADDVGENVRNLVALPYNLGVRAPIHLISRGTRTALNVLVSPWMAGQKSMKLLEDAVDWPVKRN